MDWISNKDGARGFPGLSPARLLVLVIALAASTTAPASDQDPGWYLGAGTSVEMPTRAAAGHAQDECVPLMRRCESADSGWKLAAGYRFSRYFTAEFAYGDVAETPTLDPLGLQPQSGPVVSGLNLSATATWPVLKRLDLFGRIGTKRWETPESSSLHLAPAYREDRVTMQLGAGMRYDISDSVGLRAEWEHHRGILDRPGNEIDEDVFSGYLQFRF